MNRKVYLIILICTIPVILNIVGYNKNFDEIYYSGAEEFIWVPYWPEEEENFEESLFEYEYNSNVNTKDDVIKAFTSLYARKYLPITKLARNKLHVQYREDHNGYFLYFEGGLFIRSMFVYVELGTNTLYFVKPK